MTWHYDESGSGPPLILLHGIGMSHAVWDAVTPHLRTTRRVIAFDIPGFGRTPALDAGTDPTIANLVTDLARTLDELHIGVPVDIAGNSLGGVMALEAAARGFARSVVAISPACLWRDHPPRHVPAMFRALRFMATNFGGALKAGMRWRAARELLLTVPLSPGSGRMPSTTAEATIDDLASARAFERTFHHTRTAWRGGTIAVPVTVAFGDRDWILPRPSRWRGALPAHSTWIDKPGWGHVPMWVDPAGVAELILDGIR